MKNNYSQFISNFVRLFFGLIISYLFVNEYEISEFGAYSFFLAYTAVFSKSAGFSIGNIVIREYQNDPKIIDQGFIIQTIGGLFFGFLCFFILNFISTDVDSYFIILFFIPFFFLAGFNIFSIEYFAKEKHWIPVTISLVIFLISSLIKIVIILNHASFYLFGALLGAETFLTGFIIWMFSKQKLNLFPDINIIKRTLKEALPLVLSTLSIILYLRIDQFMISEILGNAELGFYSLSVRLNEIWIIVPSILVTTNFPKLARVSLLKKGFTKLWAQVFFSFINIFSLMPILGYFFFGEILIELVSSEYLPSLNSLIILSFSILFGSYGLITHNILLLKKKTKLIFLIDLIGLTTNVIMNMFMIPSFGIEGGAFSSVISYFIANVFVLAFFAETRSIFYLIIYSLYTFKIKRLIKFIFEQFWKKKNIGLS